MAQMEKRMRTAIRKTARSAADESIGDSNLATAAEALTAAADALTTAATQLSTVGDRLGQVQPDARNGRRAVRLPGRLTLEEEAEAQIRTWEDDPFSEAVATADPTSAEPISTSVRVATNPLLKTQINGVQPPAALYDVGTPNFRYWTAAEAVGRGVSFWEPLLPPGTQWTTQRAPMAVILVAGQDLNANYSRGFGLRFYERDVKGIPIFSGESPDVVCHELGHAILDALRPELFNAASLEIPAFHESFGDMSAILSALQLPTLRATVLTETQGHLNVNSRLSRLAEQLGWAIRQLSPSAVDSDSLRNAANRFFYQPPAQLLATAPATELSSEPHSFSRVFTGAFLDVMARMLDTDGPANSDNLEAVAVKVGQLLVDGVRLAPITPAYYSQVAAAMIQVDQTRHSGRYREALTSSFVQRGILSLEAAVEAQNVVSPAKVAPPVSGKSILEFAGDNEGYRRDAAGALDLSKVEVTTRFGLTVEVHAPNDEPPALAKIAAAAPSGGSAQPLTPQEDSRAFIEDLIQTGRVEMESAGGAAAMNAFVAPGRTSDSRRTHKIVSGPSGKLLLVRQHFDCGCCFPPSTMLSRSA